MFDMVQFLEDLQSGDVTQPPTDAVRRGKRQRCQWCEQEVEWRPCAHWDQFCTCKHSNLAFANLNR